MRKFLAILVCKLGRAVGKLVGKGSSMPGKFALKICPDILARVQLPSHIIAVTGSNGEWYNTRYVPKELIDNILHSPAVEAGQKEKLQKMVTTKGQLSFYDVFTLSRPTAA